jgi:HEAT repeat protein
MPWLFWTLSALLGLGSLTLLCFSLFHDRSRGRRRCPRCWYDMAGTPGLTCSECGKTAGRERSLHKTRRRWRRVAVGTLLAALAYVSFEVPGAMSRGGLIVIIPRPILLFAIQSFDAQGDAIYQSTAAPATASSPPTGVWDRLLLARACARNLRVSLQPGAASSSYLAPFLLGELGAEADAALPIVFGLAGRPEAQARRTAMTTLANISAEPRHVIRVLSHSLHDPDAGVRAAAAGSLAQQIARSRASKGSFLSFVWAATGRGEPDEIPSATYSEAVHALASALQTVDRSTRIVIVRTLGTVGPPDESIIEPIAASIDDTKDSTRVAGLTAVAQFGPASVPTLVRFLSHPDAKLRACAASWLGQNDHPGAAAVEPLRALTHDLNDTVRDTAITALIRIGPPARPAIPDLRQVRATDRNGSIRTLALLALEATAADEAIPVITEALGDADDNIRRNAADILGRFGPRAGASVPDLARLSSDPSMQVQEAAHRSINLIQPNRYP